jgi:hypothetical protein
MGCKRFGGMLCRQLLASLVLLLVCQCGIAGNCGTALRATDLGQLSENLSGVNQMLLSDLASRGAKAAAERGAINPGTDLEQQYKIVIAAMRLQAVVDRLAVLTQLRDLMRQPEDRMIVQATIATFAARASELGGETVARLGQKDERGANAETAAHIEQLRGLATRVAQMLKACEYPGQ